MGRKCIDLTGQKFGRLTVIERAENKGRNVCWLCKCECGNEKVIVGGNLKSGKIMSCGCWNSEKSSERMGKQWQDEDYRKMKSEKMKEQWQDEDFRKIQSETMEKLWQDEDFRKRQSELWQDEEMKWKMGYKGGITPISIHLRNLQILTQWRKDTYIRENSKCQLTGKSVHGGNSDVHHLKAFSIIVEEAHNLHNIKIKPQVKDYTQEELKLLEEYVGSCHKDTSNAVLLSGDVHTLFHKLYGYGENTPEQFEEFRERYMAGEFKEILK